MNSLPNHHFQNKSFYQLSFDGGHLTQYGGLIFFQELFSQLKLQFNHVPKIRIVYPKFI
ncbi:IS1380-Spn1 transposase [Streptococcus pneumoniae]|nr:IS1380-Spn1 transposase [Streptococcus pneumoniae]